MSRIIVALDEMTLTDANNLAKKLAPYVWGFKLNDLLLEHGVGIIHDFKRSGKVFADPKLFDIPNTVKNSVRRLVDAGADLITVHASGGVTMLRAAVEAAPEQILAVTVLTSMPWDECQAVYGDDTEHVVLGMAEVAACCGCIGVVCSCQEVNLLKRIPLLKVCPGIRQCQCNGFIVATNDDHARVGKGVRADLIVVGRPITQADDPVKMVKEVR